MKKTITAVLFLAGTLLVSAQDANVNVQGSAQMRPPTLKAIRQDVKGALTGSATGTAAMPQLDAATAAKVKALSVEMEAKIRAIRDEYAAKFKLLGVEMPMPQPVMPRESKTMGQSLQGASSSAKGQATAAAARLRIAPPQKEVESEDNANGQGGEQGGEVKGAMTVNADAEVQANTQVPPGFVKFLRGLFGGR